MTHALKSKTVISKKNKSADKIMVIKFIFLVITQI